MFAKSRDLTFEKYLISKYYSLFPYFVALINPYSDFKFIILALIMVTFQEHSGCLQTKTTLEKITLQTLI